MPGPMPAFQREHDCQGRPDPGDGIANVVADHLRPAVRATSDCHPAAHSLNTGVVGRPVGIRPGGRAFGVAVPSKAGVYQPRIQLREAIVAQAQAPQSAGTPVVQQYVGLRDHPLESPLALWVPQVDGNALLVAVQAQVTGADPLPLGAVNERTVAAPTLSHTRPLNLDYLGAHIGKDHRTERSRNDVSDVQHPEAVERQRNGLQFVGHGYLPASSWEAGICSPRPLSMNLFALRT